MSVLFIDSADHYLAYTTTGTNTNGIVQKWGTITRTNAPSTSASGRNGGRAIRLLGTCGIGRMVNPGGSNTVRYTVGFAMEKDVAGSFPASNGSLLCFMSGSTPQWSLNYNSAGQLNLRRGRETATLVSTTTALPSSFFDSYHYIEVQVVIDDNAGSIEVHIDGETTTWTTALNTIVNTGSNAGMTTVSFEGSNDINLLVDDVYILDDVDRSVDATPDATDFLGDMRVGFSGASSANDTGAYKEWTPGTGTNHADLVDDPVSSSPCPNGDASSDYVSTAATAKRDSFLLSTLSSIADPVAVQIVHSSRSDGSARDLSSFCRQSAVNYDNAAQSVGVSAYNMYLDVLERNPATTAPWVLSEVNSPTEWGILS